MQELASKLDVPWYSVCVASPCFAAVTCLAAQKMYKEGLHPVDSPRRNELLDLPGARFARVRDISHENVDFPDYWNFHSETMARAAGLVYNISQELDADAGSLEAIRVETELRAKASNRQVTFSDFDIKRSIEFFPHRCR